MKRLKEADLVRHLENGGVAAPGTDKEDDEAEQSLAERDYQLNEALNLLKGLDIMRKPRKS